MTAPSILVVLEVEQPARFICRFDDAGDLLRLKAWLESRPEQEELVRRAVELAQREQDRAA